LQAISYHQSGGVGMTALDKIVGLADGTEFSRKILYHEKIREILMTDLDAAYLEAYIQGMVGVLQTKLLLDSKKAEVYNFLILEMNNKKA
jgi:HD superfamily phosphohydrolase YqeK